MNSEEKNIDISAVKIIEYFMNFIPVLLLIYCLLLYDSLSIIIFQNGILGTNFSDFFELSKIPFLILYLVIFGLISTGLSSYTNIAFIKIYAYTLYKYKKEDNMNLKSISVLNRIALITENKFLLEYLNNAIKERNNIQKNYRIVYSLFISIIINTILTFSQNTNTIIRFIYYFFISDYQIFIKIAITLLILPIIFTILYCIKYSVTRDDTKIFYPDVKYRKLVEEMDSLLKRKGGHST